MKQLTAIVTDVRFRMSLAIIRDLAEAGIRVVAVEFDGQTPPLGFYSKYVDKYIFMDEDKYLDQLYELCETEGRDTGLKPAIIPVSTKTMNLLLDDAVRMRFCEVAGLCLPSTENLEILNDKERLHMLAQRLQIPVPMEYQDEFDEITFPCVVKPLFGEKYGLKASERYRIVSTEIQMNAAALSFKKICRGDAVVIQQYIDGPGFGCSVFAKEGKVLASISHKRIREYPISGGPSTCCKVVHIEALNRYSEQIVKELNFTGICMFEYKQGGNGEYYLLEANPRVWGSYPLTRCAKCNVTHKWFEASVNNGNPDLNYVAPRTDFKDVRMHFLTMDIKAGLAYLSDGKPLLWIDSVADIFKWNTKGGLFEWTDMKPALKYFFAGFKKEVNKTREKHELE